MANPLLILDISDAEKWNRTTDTGIFSPLLYRLSYLGIFFLSRHVSLRVRFLILAHLKFQI